MFFFSFGMLTHEQLARDEFTSCVFQGAASYMNDVVTWGMTGSLWKPFDRILATINTVVAGLLVSHHHVGEAQFPPVTPPPTLPLSSALAFSVFVTATLGR